MYGGNDEFVNQNVNNNDGKEAYDIDESEEITQEDAWAVISAYFEEKGLVRQQLDSFDEFIQNTMQEIVDESADIEIRPEGQHNPGRQSDFVEVFFFFCLFSCLYNITIIRILKFFVSSVSICYMKS